MNKNSDWFHAQALRAAGFILEAISKGELWVSYGQVNEYLGVDRFTGSRILADLVAINTSAEAPLLTAFVGYADSRCGTVGMPGGDFYKCARDHGWIFAGEPEFTHQMRASQREALGLSDAGDPND